MDKPRVARTNKLLPFDELSPLEFERLCLWLVEREGYLRPEHLGESGNEQGRDVIAYKQTDAGEQLWYFQSKRHKQVTSATLIAEVDKYNKLVAADPTKKPTGIVFVTSASLSDASREKVRKHCEQFGYMPVFWARSELDMLVKKYPEIVREFFDLPVTSIPVLHQLPAPPPDFTGREAELAELLSMIRLHGVTISGLHGMGGAGKTTLALKLAEYITPNYPDAQFYLDLKGTSAQPLTPAEAQAVIIRSFYPEAELPEDPTELTRMYRSVLHGQRVLLLIDDAASGEQVEPLIPPVGSALIITSRYRFTIPGLFLKSLTILPDNDAIELLTKISPRIKHDAGEIARLCGYLPLALRLAGSALAERVDLNPADYCHRMREGLNDERINASFKLSYDLLDEQMQRFWRLLGIFRSTFTIEAAACIWNIDTISAQEALSSLLRYSLIEWNPSTNRYGLHELLRSFAQMQVNQAEKNEGNRILANYYVGVLKNSKEIFLKGGTSEIEALALLDLEWSNIQAGQKWAQQYANGDEKAAEICSQYPRAGIYILPLRQHPHERIQWLEAALDAARQLKNRSEEGAHLSNLGMAYDATSAQESK